MSYHPVIWSVKELADSTKKRVLNKYDSNIAVTGLTGKGKCQPKGSKILMANGSWKNIEDIKKGDFVLSPQKDGSNIFAKVTRLSNWFCDDVYDVKQINRAKKRLYSCSGNHTIPYLYRRNQRINGVRNNKIYEWIYKEVSAERFSEFSKFSLGHNKIGFSSFKIDKFKGRNNCEIEPYTLGVWLGDGHFSSKKMKNKNFNKEFDVKNYYRKYSSGKISFIKSSKRKLSKNAKEFIICYRDLGITSNDFSIIKEISKYYSISGILKKQNTTAKTYRFSLNGKLAKQLIKYNFEGKGSGTKFIPKNALLSDYDYRIKLLAGLIDTDGHYSNGGYSFTLKSKKLIEDIKELVYSLGGRTGEIRKVKKQIKSINFEGTYYSIFIYLCDTKIPLKVEHKIKKDNSIYLSSNRIGIEVQKSTPKKVYGFSIKSPSKWYITDNWMVTHNSTFLFKFFNKFDDFKIEDKLIYERGEMIGLIRDHKNSYCWNDELISSANKRKFYDTEQIELLEVLTKYRNNLNILGGAVPIFFSLDKELLKLFGMHIHIIDRGIGVVHLPREGRMFSDDIWDIKINAKLEEKWSAKIQKNPHFKIPYHKYTTFAGYVYFGKMTEKQEEYYEHLKNTKRGDADSTEEEKPKENFFEKVLRLLREGKMDSKGLFLLCSYEGKKLSSVKVSLNRMLKDEGSDETLKDLLKDTNNNKNNNLLHNNNTIKELSLLEPPTA